MALFCKEWRLSKQHDECLSNWITVRNDNVWAFLAFLSTTVHGNVWGLHTVAALPPRSEVTVIVPLEPIWVPRPLDGSTKLTVLYLSSSNIKKSYWKNNNIPSFATGGSLLKAVYLDALYSCLLTLWRSLETINCNMHSGWQRVVWVRVEA